MIELTINEKKVLAEPGELLMEVCRREGIDVPALCYDKDLPIDGSCRMCVVEIEGSHGLAASCATQVRQGMKVHTESERVVKTRRSILRLYLDNHPNDCLTCEKAGSCLLQEYAYRYDVKFREHDGARRGNGLAGWTDTSSPYILRDESKCILCGKCVRTCAAIPDRHVLGYAGRGFHVKISADDNTTLEESTCVSCSRCVVVCPVGALIDRRTYEARIRSWEGRQTTIKCKSCDYGCNFILMEKDGKKVVRPRRPTNGRPLCLRGRLFTEARNNSELPTAYQKVQTSEGRRFKAVPWSKALELDEVLQRVLMQESDPK
ncbi:NAD-dependent formate dehydrogenase alpha subunit, selenocysteine-containing [Clostridiaceae bacterium JG1575]|nr:NAD-dependent formate dehydrogenase alpha subunit, selenocysteine-containing [Clostridiaceae bacterium JG1575]